MIIALIILAWAVCGVFTYGAILAYFQREFPSIATAQFKEDVKNAFFIALVAGPVSFIVCFFFTDFFKHGFMWKRPAANLQTGQQHE